MIGSTPVDRAAPPVVPLVLLLVAVGLAGLNVRAALGSVPPLLPEIRSDLAISNAQAGLITSLAVVSLGLFAPLGQRLGARIGAERATGWCLAALCVAEASRLIPAGLGLLFVTTVATGATMGAASSMIPALISEYAGRRSGLAMGVYSTGMSMGVAAAAAVALPLESALGGWRASLAALAVGAALASLVWVLVMVRGRPSRRAAASGATRRGLPWTARTAQLVTAFLAMQMLVGYGCMAWIAPLYLSRGSSARDAAALFVVFQVVQLATMLGLPILTDMTSDRRPLLVFAALCSAVGIALMLVGHVSVAVPAVALCGLGIGGGATLGLVLVVDSTSSVQDGVRLTAMTLLVANIVGATSPLLLGVVKDSTGSFGPGLAVLLGVNLVMLVLITRFRPGMQMLEVGRERPDESRRRRQRAER